MYLGLAARNGAVIRTSCEVRRVAEAPGGGYAVTVVDDGQLVVRELPRRDATCRRERCGHRASCSRPARSRAPFAGHRRRPAQRAPHARDHHPRLGRALRAPAARRGGAQAAQAAGDQGAPAQGRGVFVPRDLPDHVLDLHEGRLSRIPQAVFGRSTVDSTTAQSSGSTRVARKASET
jgi:hypothetical protein